MDAILTLAVIAVSVGLMVAEHLSPDILLLAALAVLVTLGILDVETALEGFANPTLVTIGSLFVIAGGLRDTGALEAASRFFLGATAQLRSAILRLSTTTAGASAFLGNTSIVAMGIPLVRGWAERRGIEPSRLLMPLSFASILGGICTLIGTSTNLVTSGLLEAHGMEGLGFFELTVVGVPVTIVGILYLVFIAPRLLPARKEIRTPEDRARERTLEMQLDPDSALAGLSLSEAGLEDQPGRALLRLERAGQAVAASRSEEQLREGDRLTFAGNVEQLRTLEARPGLRRVVRRTPLEARGAETHEVVVGEGSSLIGERIRTADFPGRYNAAVTGAQRDGRPVEKDLGEIVLRAGDTLLLSTGPGFREAFEDSLDFLVVSEAEEVPEAEAARGRKRAIGVLATVVLVMASGILPVSIAALFGAVSIVALGAISPGDARRTVDWSVLIVIGAALGLANAMEESGAAAVIGEGLVDVGMALGPVGILAAIFTSAMLFTMVITNNAAAALMFPIALSAAQSQGLEARPFLIAITVAASLAFATPLGYQTNLMVYGPGGYRFSDFVRVGVPLQILAAAVAIAVIWVAWSPAM